MAARKGATMTIRKTGAADGRITGTEEPREEDGITVTASATTWDDREEDALAAENEAADPE
jgi:hypothetical protein